MNLGLPGQIKKFKNIQHFRKAQKEKTSSIVDCSDVKIQSEFMRDLKEHQKKQAQRYLEMKKVAEEKHAILDQLEKRTWTQKREAIVEKTAEMEIWKKKYNIFNSVRIQVLKNIKNQSIEQVRQEKQLKRKLIKIIV